MKVVFGLGNPGTPYLKTRHNLGWRAVETLAEKHGWAFHNEKTFHASIAEGRFGQEKILLVHPLTFMNLSGECVRSVVQYYKTSLQDVLIVQDELDLPFGQLAFKASGGDAGHNGIASIHQQLATREVARLRLGIGRPTTEQPVEDYVLQPFPPEEASLVAAILPRAADAITTWAEQGLAKAMNVWNGVE